MDLKSIINADSSNSASSRPPPPPPPPGPKQQHTQSYQNFHQQHSPGPHNAPPQQYGGRYDARPPQPPPIRPPSHQTMGSPSGSISYQSLQSPYGTTPSSASVGGNQYPFPPSDPQSRPLSTQSNNSQYSQQRMATGPPPVTQVYGQASPAPVTPTGGGPINAYGYPQYQHTPSSQPAYTPLPAQNHAQMYPRDGYQSVQTPNSTQRYSYPQMAQQSQPATPLGPPPALSRSNTMRRDGSISYAYDHQRTQSGSSYGHSPKSAQSSATLERNGSIPLAASPPGSISRAPPVQSHHYVNEGDRERSLSVSPKTRLNPEPPHVEMSMGLSQEQQRRWSKSMDLEQAPPPHFDPYKESPQAPLTQYVQSQPPPPNDARPLNGTNSVPTRGYYDAEPVPYPEKYGTIPSQIPARLNETSAPLRVSSYRDRPSQPVINTQDHPLPRAVHLQSSTPHESSFDQTTISNASPTPPATAHSASSFGAPAPQTPSSSHRPTMIELTNPTVRPTPAAYQPIMKKEPSNSSTPSTPTAKTPTPQSSLTKKQEHIQHSPRPSTPSELHPRKKPRMEDVPIWARKALRGTANPQRPRHIVYKNSTHSQTPRSSSSVPPVHRQSTPKTTTNGHTASKAHQQQPTIPTNQPMLGHNGPLGPLEDSIINVQPFEELTRAISDFLFTEVVTRSDFGSVSANGTPMGPAVLEIEAKLGQLIDSNTGLRLSLPVMTETVLDTLNYSSQRGGRINFKSSMTESQHRSFNGYLNNCVKESHPQAKPPSAQHQPSTKPRIPVTYKHTKERDTFYDLPATNETLFPESILHLIRHKPKIRITTAKNDGTLLAKIIKCRLADIDVYSPRTKFDWRVSVNMEMNWEGDVSELIERTGENALRAREKDRMTYKHCGAYQIDLTQVTPTDATSHADKEHELEVEVDTAALRKQGKLLQAQHENQYADLVRGFVDNVRLLARHCRE